MPVKITKPEDIYSPVSGHPIETIANLDKIPISENGEALVRLDLECPRIIIRPVFGRKKQLWARAGVAQRLNIAQDWLDRHHPGLRIRVVDAHRTMSDQQQAHMTFRRILRLRHPTWSPELIREAANRFVAAADGIAPPPHTTGGAVDVRLVGPDGKDLDLSGGPWYSFGYGNMDAPGLDIDTKRLRRILARAMNEAGFSNYEEEWWHWSYGDSGWVLRSQLKCDDPYLPISDDDLAMCVACYDRVDPPVK